MSQNDLNEIQRLEQRLGDFGSRRTPWQRPKDLLEKFHFSGEYWTDENLKKFLHPSEEKRYTWIPRKEKSIRFPVISVSNGRRN